MTSDILFLIPLVFIGLVTSYEDIKTGKIRNRWIYGGLSWGLSAAAILLVWHVFQPEKGISLKYAGELFLNFLCAGVVGYLLWKFKGWAAGDAKLFIVFSLLLPLEFYEKSYLPVFPSFVLLVNIFFLVLLFIVVRQAVDFLADIRFPNSGRNFFQKLKTDFGRSMIGFTVREEEGNDGFFPFAAWMFAGIVLTLLIKMSVISFVMSAINRL